MDLKVRELINALTVYNSYC